MFGNFSSFMTPSLGWISVPVPTSFVSLFIFYIFSYLLLKTMGCFSGCLMSSASIQKLFCGICSVLKCSFNEFVGEKVVSLSYSSAILGPPPLIFLKRALVFPILLFSSYFFALMLRKSFLSLLAILWNSAFKWVYLSFSPLIFSQLFVITAPSDSHLAFCIYFS